MDGSGAVLSESQTAKLLLLPRYQPVRLVGFEDVCAGACNGSCQSPSCSASVSCVAHQLLTWLIQPAGGPHNSAAAPSEPSRASDGARARDDVGIGHPADPRLDARAAPSAAPVLAPAPDAARQAGLADDVATAAGGPAEVHVRQIATSMPPSASPRKGQALVAVSCAGRMGCVFSPSSPAKLGFKPWQPP